jgi:hypothetical protein
MSRSGRGNVEHETASKVRGAMGNIPEGVSRALNKARESNGETNLEREYEQKEAPPKAAMPEGLRDLILFGKIIEDVKYGPYNFKISTLTTAQQKDVFKRLFALSNEDKIANLKVFTLAEAIISFNNAPIESLYDGEDDSLSKFKKKEYVISQLQAALIDKLFQKYEEMVKQSTELFSDGGLGDSIKN